MEKVLEPNGIDFSQGFSQRVESRSCSVFNSLPANGDFCHLPIIFANSLDLDQARQNVSLMVLKKSSIQRVKYGTIIKCEGITRAKSFFADM